MTNPYLAFVESNTSGTGRLFARAARDQKLRPVLITDNPSRYDYAAEDGIEVILKNTQDEDALLEECRRLARTGGLAAVATSSEYYAEMTARIACRLGLQGPPLKAVRACRDKHRQRDILRAARCAVPAFSSATSVKSALAAARCVGLPAIVKPVSGSGSVGVRMCTTLDEVASHAKALLDQRRNERGQTLPHKILVESIAQGPEYSVEALSNRVVGITKKYLGPLPNFVEVGHDYPAELSAPNRTGLERAALSAVNALGVVWGPVHIELRLTEQGPRIIEVNPRLAGGYIPELVRLASGVDLIAQTIRAVTGNRPVLEPLANRHASIRFILAPKEGTLRSVEGLDKARRVSDVVEVKLYSDPGGKVSCRGDFRDRIGHVITCSDTGTKARLAAETAHQTIKVFVE